MTLERTIGYSGLLLIIIHALPFAKSFVMVVSILIGVGLILAATYLRWKNKINRYMHSENGMMSIPHLFQRLESEGHHSRTKKHTQK